MQYKKAARARVREGARGKPNKTTTPSSSPRFARARGGEMDRDEEMGHGDRSLLFIGDEDDDLEADRDGGSTPSSDPGSFSDRSDPPSVDDIDEDEDDDDVVGDGRRAPRDDDDDQRGTWPQSFRQSIDMMSAVPSPAMSSIITAASPNLGRLAAVGSSLLKRATSSAVGQEGLPPRARPPPPPLHGESVVPPPLPRPSSACLRSNYIDLPPPSTRCGQKQAILNGLNVLCGVGILTTSYGIKQGGWLSLILLPLLGCCSCYTGLLLKKCIDSSPSIDTYPDIGQAAFGIYGRIFVSACGVEYITLLGDSLSSVFPSADLAFGGIYLNAHNLFAITMALAILPSVWLKNLRLLSYLSAGGVIATTTVIVCLFWVGIGEGVGFHPGGTALNLTHFPVALGLYGYCYSGHSVFPNIYSSMEERPKFTFVLLFCFIVVTFVYAGVAVAGFLMFGESTMSQFTLNMPQQFIPSKIAIGMTIINPYTKYALTLTPVALSIEEALPRRMQTYQVGMCVRTALVASTVVVALTFPYFALVMALLGSVFTMLVALILPCACYLSIKKGSTPLWEVVLCITIILLGILCACVGSYTSVSQMISR
uniref:Amino acid transporter transmembrane domain-containing protein n=1 Tax=Oryza barthii TaxID=65489 RepID=A0A0D3HVZ5_9ORYZ